MNLFPNLSVTENVFMAREKTHRGVMIDKKQQREQTKAVLDRLQQAIDPDALVGELRLGQQQIIEIAKALVQDVRVLIMDEPTSALSTAEVEILFDVIRDLKAHGVSIIYISHKLDELMQIGDFITVLRDGRLVAEQPASQVDVPWIIEQMVGRNPAALFHGEAHEIGEELMRVQDLTLGRVGGGFTLDQVSFTLHRGEILGIYGLMGAGRSELCEVLSGVAQRASGQIWLEGKPIERGSVREHIQLGIALVPEDRQREGLVQTMSVADNMLLPSLRRYVERFRLSRQRQKTVVDETIRSLSVKVARPDQPVTALSGGNQQKVVVGSRLLTQPKVLLLDEPSRGIDVGAKAEIFEIINRLAQQGYAIIFISSELKEIVAMADRILVMSKGRITGEFHRGDITEEQLVAASAVGHGPRSQTNGRNPS